MTDQPEWVVAAEAKELLERHGIENAERAIIERAAAGMIQSRASSYRDSNSTREAGHVPRRFWETFVIGVKENENWSTGDFKVWTGKTGARKALGVMFRPQDVRTAFGLSDVSEPQVTLGECPRS